MFFMIHSYLCTHLKLQYKIINYLLSQHLNPGRRTTTHCRPSSLLTGGVVAAGRDSQPTEHGTLLEPVKYLHFSLLKRTPERRVHSRVHTWRIASSGAPCSKAALRVASGWLEPRGLWTNLFRLLASSSHESSFQNSGVLEEASNRTIVHWVLK